MEASELRIGNYVQCDNEIITVESIHEVGINVYNGAFGNDSLAIEATYTYEDIKQIPLTEEWLKEFGFEKSDEHFIKWINDVTAFILIPNEKINSYYLCDIDNRVDIVSVHQLQNIYYFLMGEELLRK